MVKILERYLFLQNGEFMRIYLDTGGFMALFSDGWNILKRELSEEVIEKTIFCISPFTLEEFFFKICYEKSEKELVKKFCGTVEEKPEKRISMFFKKFGKKFAGFLTGFEAIGIEKDIIFLFSNKDVLSSLTRDVKTYDILHFLTALSNKLDGFLTVDKKFIRWVSKNKSLFERENIQNFKFFLLDTKKFSLEIQSFRDL